MYHTSKPSSATTLSLKRSSLFAFVPPPSHPAPFTFWPPRPIIPHQQVSCPPSHDVFWRRQNAGWYVTPASSTPEAVLKLKLHALAPLLVSPFTSDGWFFAGSYVWFLVSGARSIWATLQPLRQFGQQGG
jgi:hypothetical protein